jgi:flavin-dependent dehydrogenase
MKKTALVGFTWVDFFSWLATEAREAGSSVLVGANQTRAWLGDDMVLSVATEDEARALGVDRIITRQSLEDAA